MRIYRAIKEFRVEQKDGSLFTVDYDSAWRLLIDVVGLFDNDLVNLQDIFGNYIWISRKVFESHFELDEDLSRRLNKE